MKLVEKPWGYELWLELNAFYCVKKLFIRQGERTSLQKHERKVETLVVLKGEPTLELNNVLSSFKEGNSITILKDQIHRLAALEGDVEILECSTPEVDDVIRLEDDYGRV